MKISYPCIHFIANYENTNTKRRRNGDIVSHIELNGSQNTTGNKVESHERSHVNPILAQFSKHHVKSRKILEHQSLWPNMNVKNFL